MKRTLKPGPEHFAQEFRLIPWYGTDNMETDEPLLKTGDSHCLTGGSAGSVSADQAKLWDARCYVTLNPDGQSGVVTPQRQMDALRARIILGRPLRIHVLSKPTNPQPTNRQENP